MNQKPNVLVFFTDQQRWDTTGAHGNPMGLTPNFDRMAREGTFLENTFSCQPVCGPARACLQTGRYPTTTGNFRNGIPLALQEKTLAHYFRESGYTTGYIGKWHLADSEPVPENQQGGYEYWLGANLLEFVSDSYKCVLYDKKGKEHRLPGYRVDAVADAGIRYIAENKDEPFFLFMSFLEPHFQNHVDAYPAPTGYARQYSDPWTPPDLRALGGSSAWQLAGYYGMVKRLDEALGRIQDALKSLDLDKNTIILFITDHGCHFKTRNGEYKRSCHEASIRLPCALTGPGFDGGGRITDLVSLVDLPPTLLAAAGIDVPECMEGIPLQEGKRESVFVQISESQVGRAVRTRRWKLGVTAPGLDGNAASSSPEYLVDHLYDLENDPWELNNLVGRSSHDEVTDKLVAVLKDHIRTTEGQEAQIRPAAEKPAGQYIVDPAEAL